MKAVVVGATGAVGKELVKQLLDNEIFSEVIVFVRKELKEQNPKLKVNIIDFDDYESWKDLVKGDVLFSCLGTTIKAAGSKEAQWKVDYEYQYKFAEAGSINNIKNYVLVSARYADPNSKMFYTNLKGKLEEAIKKLSFEKISIFRPSFLIRENSNRIGEKIGVKILKLLNFLGLFKDMKPISTSLLAKTLIKVVQNNKNNKEKEVIIFENKDIFKILE